VDLGVTASDLHNPPLSTFCGRLVLTEVLTIQSDIVCRHSAVRMRSFLHNCQPLISQAIYLISRTCELGDGQRWSAPGTNNLATDATILVSNLLQPAGLRSKPTAWDRDTRLTICWRAAWPWLAHDLGGRHRAILRYQSIQLTHVSCTGLKTLIGTVNPQFRRRSRPTRLRNP
jgi:hypothetical protein